VKKGFTPLHFAVQGTPRPSLVETLLKAGAEVNRVDDVRMIMDDPGYSLLNTSDEGTNARDT